MYLWSIYSAFFKNRLNETLNFRFIVNKSHKILMILRIKFYLFSHFFFIFYFCSFFHFAMRVRLCVQNIYTNTCKITLYQQCKQHQISIAIWETWHYGYSFLRNFHFIRFSEHTFPVWNQKFKQKEIQKFFVTILLPS